MTKKKKKKLKRIDYTNESKRLKCDFQRKGQGTKQTKKISLVLTLTVKKSNLIRHWTVC